MESRTYREIAGSWELWCEYIDQWAVDTREEWDALTVEERVAQIVACCGPERWTLHDYQTGEEIRVLSAAEAEEYARSIAGDTTETGAVDGTPYGHPRPVYAVASYGLA